MQTLWARTILANYNSELMRTAAMQDVIARARKLLGKAIKVLGNLGRDLYRISKALVRKTFRGIWRKMRSLKGRDWTMLAMICVETLALLMIAALVYAIMVGAVSSGSVGVLSEMLGNLMEKGVEKLSRGESVLLLTIASGLASLSLVFSTAGMVHFAGALKDGVKKIHAAFKHHRSVKGKRFLQSVADELEKDLAESA